MSSFTIPVNDPGAPRLQTFPDVIRGETMDGFLRRDRFVYATSRRLLVSVPNYSTTPARSSSTEGKRPCLTLSRPSSGSSVTPRRGRSTSL
jgi:hypothetical protein